MKKFILLFIIVFAFETYPQYNGGWKLGGGIESIIGVGDFSGQMPFSMGPVVQGEFQFPFSYLSVGGSLGILFASEGTQNTNHYHLTSLKIGIPSKIQLGSSQWAFSVEPILLIPLTDSKYDDYWYNWYDNTTPHTQLKLEVSPIFLLEASGLAKISLTPSISSILKLGIGLVPLDRLQCSINLGFMVQGNL